MKVEKEYREYTRAVKAKIKEVGYHEAGRRLNMDPGNLHKYSTGKARMGPDLLFKIGRGLGVE